MKWRRSKVETKLIKVLIVVRYRILHIDDVCLLWFLLFLNQINQILVHQMFLMDFGSNLPNYILKINDVLVVNT